MYKFLLCLRYLRTRYIALASIISVTLGVATMIVVNAVMSGFSHEMKTRLHDILSDIVIEHRSLVGMYDAVRHMEEIRRIGGDEIVGMTPTAFIPAMLRFSVNGEYITRQVNVVGIDVATYNSVSEFGKYLQHPGNREKLSFDLRNSGYDIIDHQAEDPSRVIPRLAMEIAGWNYRRQKASFQQPVVPEPAAIGSDANPFEALDAQQGKLFNPATDQHVGCVLGMGICSFKTPDGADNFQLLPGDDIDVSYPTAGHPPKVQHAKFTVVDFYESKMQDYDSTYMFVPLETLQELRGMIDPQTGARYVNSIQIKLAPGVDLDAFRDKLQSHFPQHSYVVSTWRDKQGPLLAAVQQETILLNILLFLIVLVSGFGILAIFFMIVVEKTRDIGILKSLGASGGGVMQIFLIYGLGLGIVGAGVGTIGGVLFAQHINTIGDLVAYMTGRPVFPPDVYFFSKIPTRISPWMILFVGVGAVLVAVLASILPAWRAASLHPVKALRFE